MKPPRTPPASLASWTKWMKPRDWFDLVAGVLMLLVAFLGVTHVLPMPWWVVLILSLGYVLLVGGVMVRVRARALR